MNTAQHKIANRSVVARCGIGEAEMLPSTLLLPRKLKSLRRRMEAIRLDFWSRLGPSSALCSCTPSAPVVFPPLRLLPRRSLFFSSFSFFLLSSDSLRRALAASRSFLAWAFLSSRVSGAAISGHKSTSVVA